MCGSIRKNQSLSILPILLNAGDEDAKKVDKDFYFLNKTAVNEIIAAHNTDASKRLLQKTLAKRLPHSCMVKKNTIRHWRQQKNYLVNQSAPAESLSVEDLEKHGRCCKVEFSLSKLEEAQISFLFSRK